MIFTVCGFKGGIAKSTTAVHLAAQLSLDGPTVLVDGDPNRSALGWSRRGSLPFPVVDERQAAKHIRDASHVVIDTAARPSREDIEALADGCDLLILPTTPDALALDALLATIEALQSVGSERYRVLLTIVPPKPSRDGDEARAAIVEAGLPIFKAQVRRAVAFQKAAAQGVLVGEVNDPRASEASWDYRAVAEELLP